MKTEYIEKMTEANVLIFCHNSVINLFSLGFLPGLRGKNKQQQQQTNKQITGL